MKTISLTDDAYERLLSWKESSKESFSSVVLKIVPKRGTLADLASEIDKLPPLTDEQAGVMEDAVKQADKWSNYRDPWTS